MFSFIKNNWYIFVVSIVILIPMIVVCPIFAYIAMELLKNTILSYVLSCIICGEFCSLPIILSLIKNKYMTTHMKILCSLVSISIFSVVLFVMINL